MFLAKDKHCILGEKPQYKSCFGGFDLSLAQSSPYIPTGNCFIPLSLQLCTFTVYGFKVCTWASTPFVYNAENLMRYVIGFWLICKQQSRKAVDTHKHQKCTSKNTWYNKHCTSSLFFSKLFPFLYLCSCFSEDIPQTLLWLQACHSKPGKEWQSATKRRIQLFSTTYLFNKTLYISPSSCDKGSRVQTLAPKIIKYM